MYIIKWKQKYTGWDNFVESNIEALLEKSDYREANAVISYIKHW